MKHVVHDNQKQAMAQQVGLPTLTRRSLVRVSALAGGMLAMAACSWTPRNAQPGKSNESPTQQNTSTAQQGSVSPADVNDGLTLVNGGTFTMGSPTDEPWRGDDEVAHEVTVSDFYLAPNAHVGQGLSIYYSGGADMPQQVSEWIKK